MSFVPRGGTFNIVRQRQLTVDEETLEKIAELLGIQGQVISGTIYISDPPSPRAASTPPSPLSETAPPSPPSETAPPSPTSRRTRQRK